MAALLKFPYLKYDYPTVSIYRPEVNLQVVGSKRMKTVRALCDTGADYTLLPESVGDYLNIAMDDRKRYHIQGVTGHTIRTMTGTVTFDLSDDENSIRWKTEVHFIPFRKSGDEFAVLGHVGGLEFFTATFDGKAHELTLKPNTRLPKT